MEYTVSLQQQTDLGLYVGEFEDVVYLVNLLNSAWESIEFRLEEIEGKKGSYLFVQDDKEDGTAEVGVLERSGEQVYAFTPAVHGLVLGAYQRYVQEFGDPVA